MAKTWTDQPNEVIRAEIVVSRLTIEEDDGALQIEIRQEPETSKCFLTVGNLFGSQTICCMSPIIALRVLGMIAARKNKPFRRCDLPAGSFAMENADPGE